MTIWFWLHLPYLCCCLHRHCHFLSARSTLAAYLRIFSKDQHGDISPIAQGVDNLTALENFSSQHDVLDPAESEKVAACVCLLFASFGLFFYSFSFRGVRKLGARFSAQKRGHGSWLSRCILLLLQRSDVEGCWSHIETKQVRGLSINRRSVTRSRVNHTFHPPATMSISISGGIAHSPSTFGCQRWNGNELDRVFSVWGSWWREKFQHREAAGILILHRTVLYHRGSHGRNYLVYTVC